MKNNRENFIELLKDCAEKIEMHPYYEDSSETSSGNSAVVDDFKDKFGQNTEYDDNEFYISGQVEYMIRCAIESLSDLGDEELLKDDNLEQKIEELQFQLKIHEQLLNNRGG